jgi:hypothetical protein
MWRIALTYVYAALLALSLRPLGLYNDLMAPLFWKTVLARVPENSLPPGVVCELLERAQLPRNDEMCGAAAPRRAAPPPPQDQEAP